MPSEVFLANSDAAMLLVRATQSAASGPHTAAPSETARQGTEGAEGTTVALVIRQLGTRLHLGVENKAEELFVLLRLGY